MITAIVDKLVEQQRLKKYKALLIRVQPPRDERTGVVAPVAVVFLLCSLLTELVERDLRCGESHPLVDTSKVWLRRDHPKILLI